MIKSTDFELNFNPNPDMTFKIWDKLLKSLSISMHSSNMDTKIPTFQDC